MSTTQDQRDSRDRREAWSSDFARRASRLRERAQQLGQTKRQNLRQLETRLAEQLQALGEELARQSVAQSGRSEACEEQTVELKMQAEEVAELRQKCRRLTERLAEAERRLEERPAESADAQRLEDVQRRFELAVQDARELKNQNADLRRELEAARRCESASASSGDGGGSDWESQKKRLMQQLDDDFGSGENKHAADRLTVEGAMRITDQVVAEKEREIQELKRLINEQPNEPGPEVADPVSATAVLDQDEMIRQERENLKRIQDEWRDKLRQAEVDISLERARLARERSELEEKIMHLASVASAAASGDSAGGEKAKKPRRWLSLLVKDNEPG